MDALPHTISYIIRKKQQVDGFNELPKEKRPTEKLIWDGSPEEIDTWLERVFDNKKKVSDETFTISEDEIEQ